MSLPNMNLAVVASHPIQYQAPWFRALATHPNLDLHVFFCRVATPTDQANAGFGVTFDWDTPLLEGYSFSVLTAHEQPERANNGLDPGAATIETLVNGSYDAVIVLGWNEPGFRRAIWASWRAGCPVLVRGDSNLHTERAAWKRALKWPMYRTFIPRFSACLAVGQWSREYFLHYGARPDRVFTVPHVVDERFGQEAVALEPERTSLRRHWSLNENQVVFTFVGKFLERKRPMDFVRAIEHASSRNARVAGLMVGDGPLRAACEEYTRDRNLPLRFTGFLNQSQMTRAYTASDALVLPSDGSETWGLVVNEAMACGLPCIVSDRVGCGPDLIISGKTGSTYEFASVEQLSQTLEAYACDRRRLQSMRAEVLELTQTFRPAVAVEGLMAAVNSVLSLGRACA